MVIASTLAEVSSWIWRNWAFAAIAITCLSLLTFVTLLLAKYVRICLNIFIDTPVLMKTGPLDFQHLHGEVSRFRSLDGTSLRGMLINPPNRAEPRGAIVFCHEYGSDMYSCARYTRPLIEAGFSVFPFDYRGHGESSSSGKYKPLQWPSDKEVEDTLGACVYLEAMLSAQGRGQKIGIFGVSRGGGAALLAASTNANISAIICDSTFSTEITLVALMKRWASIFARIKLVYQNHTDSFWRFLLWLVMRFAQPKLGCKFPSVYKALKEMQPRPILFILGQRDGYVSEQQCKVLHAAAPEPKYLWIVKQAKHNQSVVVEPKQYAQRTIAFFNEHLAGESAVDQQVVKSGARGVA